MAWTPATRRRRRRLLRWTWRALLRRLLFALVPVALLPVAAELAARLLWSPAAPAKGVLMVPHPTRIWAMAPGVSSDGRAVVRIDSRGLREVADTGAPYRVLTLGDSSIFGYGLGDPDTLHARLRAALARRGVESDVFCGGVPGYSTEQSLLLLDEVGWSLRPDLLVIGDLWSDNNMDWFVDRDLVARGRTAAQRLERLLSRSRAWSWLRQRRLPPDRRGLPIGWARRPDQMGERRVPLQDYARNLDRMLLEASDRAVGVVMLLPANRLRYQADDRGPASWKVYFDAARRVARRRGTPVLDAANVLSAAGIDPDDAFIDELHPTGAANALYASALAELLLSEGWPRRWLVPDELPEPWSQPLVDPWAGRGETPKHPRHP